MFGRKKNKINNISESNENSESYTLRFNVFSNNEYGSRQSFWANIFLNGKYFNSTILEKDSWDKALDIDEKIIKKFLLPLTNKTDFSWKKTFNQEVSEPKCEVFEYVISNKTKKPTYQKLKEKILEKGRADYYKNYCHIQEFEKDYIKSSCWDAGYRDKVKFEKETMPEQKDALEKHIEEKYGVKIKINNIPSQSSIENSSVKFKYEIKEVLDESKLEPKEKVKFNLTEQLESLIVKERYSNDNEKNDVLELKKPSAKVSLYEAIDSMFRNPSYMYFLKEHEQDLLEDYDNFKDRLMLELKGERTYCDMNTRMFSNFKKLMPELYKKMFGDVPTGLIPVTVYRKYEEHELSEIVEDFKTPKLI